eukprot:3778963-Pleurochrysis_carterae.AAC.1
MSGVHPSTSATGALAGLPGGSRWSERSRHRPGSRSREPGATVGVVEFENETTFQASSSTGID